MNRLTKFNLILLVLFATGALIISLVLYGFLIMAYQSQNNELLEFAYA